MTGVESFVATNRCRLGRAMRLILVKDGGDLLYIGTLDGVLQLVITDSGNNAANHGGNIGQHEIDNQIAHEAD